MMMSRAARINLEETGMLEDDIQTDIRAHILSITQGDVSPYRLLDRCLDGADEDRHQGWRDYVDYISAMADAGTASTLVRN